MDRDLPNIKRWVIFYPIYINSKKTLAEGRRISAIKACESPTCLEIGDCCKNLQLPFAVEVDKAYPRDFMQRGRVRVLLKNIDGRFYNPEITSRKQLMLKVAELVPEHHGRTMKQQPSVTHTAGTSKPSVTHNAGTSKPSVTHTAGTSKPSVTHNAGTSKPSVTHTAGTSKPSGTRTAGTSKSGKGGRRKK